MIKFFRNIRQNLLLEGKAGNYLKYAISEIVLVVIGILIALQINNWNEQRKLKVTTDAYIERLISDIVADTLAIHNGLNIRRQTIANIETYFEYYESTKTSLKVAIDSAVNVQFGLWRYIPVNQTYEDMKSTGNLNLLSQQQQKKLSLLANAQETELLVDEKLMASFYEQVNLANNYLERRRTGWNRTVLRKSGTSFKSVYEVFNLKEDPQRLTQGLIHWHNTLVALLNYHNVAIDANLKIIELSKEAIKILLSKE